MPVTFRAAVWGSRSDREGEVTLTMKIPKSDRDAATEVAKLTEQVLIVTVFESHEVCTEDDIP